MAPKSGPAQTESRAGQTDNRSFRPRLKLCRGFENDVSQSRKYRYSASAPTGPPSRSGLFFLGALMIGLGILALSYPLVSTLAVELTLGILLAIAGFATLVHAFWDKEWTGFIWQILIAVVYLFGGGDLLSRPARGDSRADDLSGRRVFRGWGVADRDGHPVPARRRDGACSCCPASRPSCCRFTCFSASRRGSPSCCWACSSGVNFIFVGATLLAFGFGIRDEMTRAAPETAEN